MKKSRFTEEQIVAVLKNADKEPAVSVCRRQDISTATLYSWASTPQRFNPDEGGMESMEQSHEPGPAREGSRDFVPRWPQDHAAVDPHRRPGY